MAISKSQPPVNVSPSDKPAMSESGSQDGKSEVCGFVVLIPMSMKLGVKGHINVDLIFVTEGLASKSV